MKLEIRNERVKITAQFHEQGSVLQGTRTGLCDGLEIDFTVESEVPPPEIARLIRLSHQMCFTEDALTSRIPITKHHQLNGQPFEIA